MNRQVTNSSYDWSALGLRFALGLVMLPHGAQKLLGWFGGDGFQGFTGWLVSTGVPYPVAVLVVLAEFFGSLGLIFGLLGRFSAFGIASVMLGAIFMAHLPNGFFMNWTGQQPGEGFEFHLLAIGLALPVIAFGAGRFSLDQVLFGQRRERVEETQVPRLAA